MNNLKCTSVICKCLFFQSICKFWGHDITVKGRFICANLAHSLRFNSLLHCKEGEIANKFENLLVRKRRSGKLERKVQRILNFEERIILALTRSLRATFSGAGTLACAKGRAPKYVALYTQKLRDSR